MPVHSTHEPIVKPQLKGEPNKDWYFERFETMPKYSKDFLWKTILQFKFLNEYHEDENILVLATYARETIYLGSLSKEWSVPNVNHGFPMPFVKTPR